MNYKATLASLGTGVASLLSGVYFRDGTLIKLGTTALFLSPVLFCWDKASYHYDKMLVEVNKLNEIQKSAEKQFDEYREKYCQPTPSTK